MSVTRLYEGCGKRLPATSRSDQRHHGPASRKLARQRREREHEQRATRDELTPALRQALDVATTEERLVAQIAAQAAHPGGERAAAWLLERKYPQRWGAADAGARIGARGRRRRAIAQGAAMVDVGAGPTDEQLIAGAVAEARAAGVRNSEIARVMDEAAALDDDLTIALVGGRLYRLPREVERATSA